MAGPTPAERGGTSISGIAPQEAAQPQVEYRPFSEFTPQQLAVLTGGNLVVEDRDSRVIEYPTWTMLWNWHVLNESRRLHEKHSIAKIYSLMGTWRNIDLELDQTVLVTRPNQPGVVSFVNPLQPFPVEDNLPIQYDWIEVENGSISIEKSFEGSPKVTDDIRYAARMA